MCLQAKIFKPYNRKTMILDGRFMFRIFIRFRSSMNRMVLWELLTSNKSKTAESRTRRDWVRNKIRQISLTRYEM